MPGYNCILVSLTQHQHCPTILSIYLIMCLPEHTNVWQSRQGTKQLEFVETWADEVFTMYAHPSPHFLTSGRFLLWCIACYTAATSFCGSRAVLLDPLGSSVSNCLLNIFVTFYIVCCFAIFRCAKATSTWQKKCSSQLMLNLNAQRFFGIVQELVSMTQSGPTWCWPSWRGYK